MFQDISHLIRDNPIQLNYGVAVCDVDRDGMMEIVVAGFGFRNLVLKWNGEAYIDAAPATISDGTRRSIGVAAGDLDGDGGEEIYFLNSDTFAGEKAFADRLFDYRDGNWIDLFNLPENLAALNLTAGRSVAWIDRQGTGRYGAIVANYGGPLRLYEARNRERIADVAGEARIALTTGGRSLLALPLLGGAHCDIFVGNENSPNFLFRNRGNGTFDEIAHETGLADTHQHARGVAVASTRGNGLFDVIVGNWEGPHRLFMQVEPGHFEDIAGHEMAIPSRVRTVLAADFDNDGSEEIFFNNIGEPNRMFGIEPELDTNGLPRLFPIATGDALEPRGMGTGAAVSDFDGDGRLELIIAHGETAPQPLSLFRGPENDHAWLRVMPLTRFGAPARGAIVRLWAGNRQMIRAIDAGSGYLCQMEPIAHFGLGHLAQVDRIEIQWPGGLRKAIEAPEIRRLHRIPHPLSA